MSARPDIGELTSNHFVDVMSALGYTEEEILDEVREAQASKREAEAEVQ